MNAREQIKTLVGLQELALSLRRAQSIVNEAPARIEAIEGRFRERNAEYVAVRDRHDDLERDQRERTAAVSDLEEKRKKFMDDLMQVQNQREYAAMLREIDSVKAQIADHEDAILRDMEELETVREQLKEHDEHINEERAKVESEIAEVRSETAAATAEVERLSAERAEVESGLDARTVDRVRQLEETRQGIFVTPAEGGSCGSCFVRMRPQAFQELKAASEVHICTNCRRFLYHPPSIEDDATAKDTAASDGGVGAVNGGPA